MVVRTWAMRGTLHLVATRDLGWTLAPLGPRMLANDQRRRTQLGLDAATCERALPLIRDALATRGPLTRAELAAVLAPHGIPTAGQAMPHLLYYAAYRALICFGPDHAGEPTYALIEQWLGQRFRPAPVIPPGQMVPEEARLSGLATRYIHAYGPARPEDFAAWAGVPLSLARASWRRTHSPQAGPIPSLKSLSASRTTTTRWNSRRLPMRFSAAEPALANTSAQAIATSPLKRPCSTA